MLLTNIVDPFLFKSNPIEQIDINQIINPPMKATLFLACLLVCALTFKIDNNIVTEADDRVKIDFYYESLCPYCQQYIEKSLKVATSTKVCLYINSGLLENLQLQPLSIWKCQKSSKWIQLGFYLPTWTCLMPRQPY
jgi:hypothetical protein